MPPNILFIMTDQQRFDTIAALGHPRVRTPNLDRLNAAGNNTLTNGIAGLTDTSDLDARGLETELVGNITPKWRVSFNVAKQETVVSDSAKLTKLVADAVYANRMKLNLLGIDQGPARPERQTAATRFTSNVGNPLAAALARDSAVSPEPRKWRANFTSTYDLRGFENPILMAMSVGTSVRWQGKVAIGAPFLTGQALKEKIVATNKLCTGTSHIADNDPVMQSQFPDLPRPFYGREELAGDVWASYRRKIFQDRRLAPAAQRAQRVGQRQRHPRHRQPGWQHRRHLHPQRNALAPLEHVFVLPMVRDLRRTLWLALAPTAPACLPFAFRPMRLPDLAPAPTDRHRSAPAVTPGHPPVCGDPGRGFCTPPTRAGQEPGRGETPPPSGSGSFSTDCPRLVAALHRERILDPDDRAVLHPPHVRQAVPPARTAAKFVRSPRGRTFWCAYDPEPE